MLQLLFFPTQVSSSMTTKPLKKRKEKVLDWYLSRGLIIIHVQHFAKQTPFSKGKSPESPKHRKEKVREKGKSEGKGERREEQVRKEAVRQDVLRCSRPHYYYYYYSYSFFFNNLMCLVLYSLLSECG